jgi:hypothetical protein
VKVRLLAQPGYALAGILKEILLHDSQSTNGKLFGTGVRSNGG